MQRRHQPTSLNASIKWNYLFQTHFVWMRPKIPIPFGLHGFNLILLLIKKIRCSIFNNRRASLHRIQWLRLNWRLCVAFAVLEEHSYSNKSRHHWFTLHSSVCKCAFVRTKQNCNAELQFSDIRNEQHSSFCRTLNIVWAIIYSFSKYLMPL